MTKKIILGRRHFEHDYAWECYQRALVAIAQERRAAQRTPEKIEESRARCRRYYAENTEKEKARKNKPEVKERARARHQERMADESEAGYQYRMKQHERSRRRYERKRAERQEGAAQ